MRRIVLYTLGCGAVDAMVRHTLTALRPHAERLVVVVDSPVSTQDQEILASLADAVLESPLAPPVPGPTSAGAFTARHSAAVRAHEQDELERYDEVLLVDDRCFGPITDVAPLFTRMDDTATGVWSLTSSRRPDAPGQVAPDDEWLGFRRSVVASPQWAMLWQVDDDRPLAQRLLTAGASWLAAYPVTDYSTDHPVVQSAHLLISDGCPIVHADAFAADPLELERDAVIGRRTLAALEATDFPLHLLWSALSHRAEPRQVHTNLSLLEILNDEIPDPQGEAPPAVDPSRIAVLAHIYYDDLVPDMMRRIASLPAGYHLSVTTDTVTKQASVLRQLRAYEVATIDVRVVDSNRGRDTSALLVGQRDLLTSDDYTLICRIHSKKSPQDAAGVAALFRDHLYDNLLASPGYVARVLRLFAEHPTLGMAIPPVIHIGYPTLGHAWFANREPAQRLAHELGIGTRFDASTPLAAYGSMFWARPEALRKLLAREWQYADFPDEGGYQDGSLTHVIERLLAYTVLDAGFHVRSIMTPEWAGVNYPFLEYKHQRLAARLPGRPHEQIAYLDQIDTPLLGQVKDHVARRFPATSRTLAPVYSMARAVYRRASRS